MTTLAQEQAEQSKWRVLPGQPPALWADELLRNEFLDPSELAGRVAYAQRLMLTFASGAVPFWKRRLAGVDVDAPDALLRLPPLTRDDVQAHGADLRDPDLAPNENLVTRSSGTTGAPIGVQQSPLSGAMFTRIKQREDRWFRFDPLLKMGSIKPKTELPRMPDGSLWSDDLVLHAKSWPYLGRVFQTGPFVAFSNLNPVERQAEFVDVEAPNYLSMQAAGLEHVALANRGAPALRACLATSQTLTAPMRANVERAFGVPVHQNYGFNEIGIVASRCPEGGRYHVHVEHCVVEIVDADGRPVRAGERGRILVTSLTNRAMPLLRYDCDDFATAVEGPCPCGRTLPSFGEIHGRYRRIAPLPPGSWKRWGAIQYALSVLPPDLAPSLRRYQAHEYADRWVLRIDATDDKAQAIGAFVREKFVKVAADPPPLEILATAQFEGRPGTKFQDFWSDFVPSPEAP